MMGVFCFVFCPFTVKEIFSCVVYFGKSDKINFSQIVTLLETIMHWNRNDKFINSFVSVFQNKERLWQKCPENTIYVTLFKNC